MTKRDTTVEAEIYQVGKFRSIDEALDVPTFVTTDLGGLHVRCPACRRHRPGSDFLQTETRCRDCDGGVYDRSLARRGDELEAPGHRRGRAD